MPYCLDTNAFIDCWTRLYPIDIFPGIWEKLEGLAESGDLICPREVLEELSRKEDGVHRWAKDRQDLMFVELDEAIQDATSAILAGFPLLVKEFAERTQADPFVIAVAQVRGIPVVTQEHSGRAGRPKIPDVCAALDVQCIDVLQFIRENGWTFP
jgi:hypothetical protein